MQDGHRYSWTSSRLLYGAHGIGLIPYSAGPANPGSSGFSSGNVWKGFNHQCAWNTRVNRASYPAAISGRGRIGHLRSWPDMAGYENNPIPAGAVSGAAVQGTNDSIHCHVWRTSVRRGTDFGVCGRTHRNIASRLLILARLYRLTVLQCPRQLLTILYIAQIQQQHCGPRIAFLHCGVLAVCKHFALKHTDW